MISIKVRNFLENNKQIILILIFLVYSIWKFYPAFEVGISVSAPNGDGLGTVAYFSELTEQIKEKPLSYFLSDLTTLDKTGLGTQPPVPINIVQKVIIYVLSFFAEFDNIYDSYAFISFFLIGIISFLLLKEIEIGFILSTFGALLLLSNDNLYNRLTGHLTLSMSFAPILLTYITVRAAKKPTMQRMALIPIATIFNFSMNEYYGYFGVYFTVFLFLGLYIYYHNSKDVFQKDNLLLLLKKVCFISIILIIGMSIVYPNLVGIKFLGKLFPANLTPPKIGPVHRSYPEFIVYSIKNHLYFFTPNLDFLRSLFNLKIFSKSTFYEQSFRVGILAPIFIFIFYYTVTTSLFFKKRYTKKILFPFFLVPSIAIMYLLSNDPTKGLSLVPFTYKVSEVFRIASRSYLYILISVIMIFIFCLNYFFKTFKSYITEFDQTKVTKITSNTAYLFIYCILVISSFMDISHLAAKSQIPVFQLPKASIYKELKNLEKGLVLEVPLFRFPDDHYEKGYIYTYNRSLYQSRLFNTMLPIHNDNYRAFSYIHEILKKPTRETIIFLRKIGIKYIVINRDYDLWRNLVDENVNISIVLRNKSQKVLRIINSKNISPQETLHEIRLQPDFLTFIPTTKSIIKKTIFLKNETDIYSSTSNHNILHRGFSSAEQWGVWTNSKEALVKFGLATPPKYLEIEFNIFTNGHHKQNVEFLLNNKSVYKKELLSVYNKVKIPVKNYLKDINQLLIKVPNAVSPQTLDSNNSDTRVLGIGIISIQLK